MPPAILVDASHFSSGAGSPLAAATLGSAPTFPPPQKGCEIGLNYTRNHSECFYHPLLDGGSACSASAGIVSVLPKALDELARCKEQTTDDEPETSGRASCFHVLRQPGIGVSDYCHRIAKYSKCSPVCFAFALIFMQRLAEKDSIYHPAPLNVHRLLITGVMLAAKLVDDSYFTNSYYAKIGGISTADLNSMELAMLQLLEYRLHAPEAQLLRCLAGLQAYQDTGPISSPLDQLPAQLRAGRG